MKFQTSYMLQANTITIRLKIKEITEVYTFTAPLHVREITLRAYR